MLGAMSCLPPPLVPPGQAFDACRYLLLDCLELHQEQTLACRCENEIPHRQMLGCQQCTRFELLQVTKRESRQWHAKFNPEWDLSKVLGKGNGFGFREAFL